LWTQQAAAAGNFVVALAAMTEMAHALNDTSQASDAHYPSYNPKHFQISEHPRHRPKRHPNRRLFQRFYPTSLSTLLSNIFFNASIQHPFTASIQHPFQRFFPASLSTHPFKFWKMPTMTQTA
jgi:hypothetical protein